METNMIPVWQDISTAMSRCNSILDDYLASAGVEGSGGVEVEREDGFGGGGGGAAPRRRVVALRRFSAVTAAKEEGLNEQLSVLAAVATAHIAPPVRSNNNLQEKLGRKHHELDPLYRS